MLSFQALDDVNSPLMFVCSPFRHLHIQVGQGALEGLRVVLSPQQGEDQTGYPGLGSEDDDPRRW